MKEEIWLTHATYLWLSLNTSWALVFCIDTHLCTVFKFTGTNKGKEICLPNMELDK